MSGTDALMIFFELNLILGANNEWCWTIIGKLTIWILSFRVEKAGSQVGFAEFNNTADNRANIGGTIIGAPIVGQ